MAKYTETYQEYLANGGEVPAKFAEVEGFADDFYNRYCTSEIGFETEGLFLVKLTATANEVIPNYKDMLAVYDFNIARLKLGGSKQISETLTYGEKHTTGNSEGSDTELPINASTASPSSTSHSEDETTEDAHNDTREKTESPSAIDRAKLLDMALKERKSMLTKLLDEFKSCFMQIY